jgi:hypothetical protein
MVLCSVAVGGLLAASHEQPQTTIHHTTFATPFGCRRQGVLTHHVCFMYVHTRCSACAVIVGNFPLRKQL